MAAGEDRQSKRLPPSARKLREAKKAGQVPRSPDFSGWAVMLVASYLVPDLFGFASERVVGLVGAAVASFNEPTSATALRLLGQGLYVALTATVLATGAAALVAVVTQLAQSRPVVAWGRIRPDPKHLSPLAGAKKMFSPMGLANLVKQLVKLVLVTVIAVVVVSKLVGMVGVGTVVPLGALLSTLVPQVFLLVRYISLVGVVVGVADWWYQRYRITTELKMTPTEAKEEARREEGSPEARAARRRAALRLHRQRMTGTVHGADVLVVNPTHVAIGLSYRAGTDKAPRIVARGADEVAATLRSAAARIGVPVMSDPPLARSLYRACLVGDVVPVELYEAVAKLFAQIYALARSQTLGRIATTAEHSHNASPANTSLYAKTRA